MNETVKKILIVDDEDFVRQSVVDYFEDNLWETIQANSGEEALSILENRSVDAAIVDIRMGGMDGNAFILEAIKKKYKMIFIICTGSPEYIISDALQKYDCVGKRLFVKPINNMDELLEEVVRLVSL